MGQRQVKSEDLLDIEDDLSPTERRERRSREREKRQKRKGERNEKKVQQITTKYAQVIPQRGVVDVELSDTVSRSRSESLASAFDPPTRLERYFGEAEGAHDSRRISLSFVSVMLLVAFWNGTLHLALYSLGNAFPTSFPIYYFIILTLLRFMYGVVSDSCPRRRRKPYLIFSGFAGFLVLVLAALLPCETEAAVLAIFFSLWIFAGIADVVTDGLIVERSIGKERVVVWRLQTKSLLFRGLGAALSWFGGEWFLANVSPQIMFGCLSLCPGLLVVAACFFTDHEVATPHCGKLGGICRECVGVGRTVLKKGPFFTLLMLLTLSVLPSSSLVVSHVFLKQELQFSSTMMNYLEGSAWGVCILVALLYPARLQRTSPRSTFFFASLGVVFVGLLPLIVFTGEYGEANTALVFGCAGVLRLLTVTQYLATRVLCVQVVPVGVEASLFTGLTSLLSLSALGGEQLGVAFADLLGVRCELGQCDLSNFLPFFLTCQLFPLVPLAIFGFLFRRMQTEAYVCSCLPWAKAVPAASPRAAERKVYLLSSSRGRVSPSDPDPIISAEIR